MLQTLYLSTAEVHDGHVPISKQQAQTVDESANSIHHLTQTPNSKLKRTNILQKLGLSNTAETYIADITPQEQQHTLFSMDGDKVLGCADPVSGSLVYESGLVPVA